MFSIVVAASENGVIGKGNRLPWHLPEDLKRFKKLTTGHSILMGRKTFESIGRPLPNRENIVLSRDTQLKLEGVRVVTSLEEAMLEFPSHEPPRDDEKEVFIIGGAEIYRQALPFVKRVYLTRVHTEIEGDAFFPELTSDQFREVAREKVTGEPSFSFVTYERVS